MLTVGKDALEVERKLRDGRLACSLCGGRLAPWSYARRRIVFGDGRVRWRLRPRRARCGGCGVTHVLLPVNVLARRRDEVGVIGAALARAAEGLSCETVARSLGRPVGLVRGLDRPEFDRDSVLPDLAVWAGLLSSTVALCQRAACS